ncbi:MAG: MFS transporter [Clostridia bacterium]|nr:MFS transporter [Clostridia bacterium]
MSSQSAPFRLLVPLLAGVFLGAMDNSIVAPALLSIGRDLRAPEPWIVWTVTVYSLLYATGMPLLGKLGDRWGRRRLFLAGVGLFGVGSLVAGLAPTFPVLLAGRAIQALGAGGIFPVAQAEASRLFPPERRGMVLGLFGATHGLAGILAPNIGGLILDLGSWHGIFLINVPLALLIVLMALRLPAAPPVATPSRLDVGGAVLTSAVILLAMAGITLLNPPSAAGVALLVAGLLLVWPLWRRERLQEHPFLDVRFLTRPETVRVLVLSGMTGVAITLMIYVAGFAQEVLGLTPGGSGYSLTPGALAGALVAGAGGVLVDRVGPRRVLALGLGLAVVGTALLGLWVTDLFRYIVAMLFLGASVGLTMGTPLNYMVLNLVEEGEAASALAELSVFRSLGVVVGPVLLGWFLGIGYRALFLAASAMLLMGEGIAWSLPPSVDRLPARRRRGGAATADA